MIDVHPPEHGIHGIRDFFVHLLTITVGLLIAIGLEASVEALHHRHQRNEAEAVIRQEIVQNRSALDTSDARIKTEQANMLAVLNFLTARLQGHPPAATSLSIDFSDGLLQDAAFRSAAATGVLDYMDYGEVQHFASAYKEQDLYEAIERQTLEDYLQLDAFVANGFDPDKISDDDAKAALVVVRHAIAHLDGMQASARGLHGSYETALKN